MSDTQTIPAEVAAHVLWSEDLGGGYAAGAFTTHLMRAWGVADVVNASRLAAGWPAYAAAFELLVERGGVERLQAIAGRR